MWIITRAIYVAASCVIYVESIIGRSNSRITSVLNLTPELTTGDY